jgi:hypothetical protein
MVRIITSSSANLGNLSFQLNFAYFLKEAISESKIYFTDVERKVEYRSKFSFDILRPEQFKLEQVKESDKIEIKTQNPKVEELIHCANLGEIKHIYIKSICCRMQFLRSKKFLNSLLKIPDTIQTNGHDDKIVISVRGCEILEKCHRDYIPIPVSFYKNLVKETGLSPLFYGQIGDDFYSEALRKNFPNALFYASKDPFSDFEFLLGSRYIVPSVSTFSWLAAFLSRAEKVFLPVLGFINPLQRPDIDLLPNDKRYSFYCFPKFHYQATEEQKKMILNPVADLAVRPSIFDCFELLSSRPGSSESWRNKAA